MNMQFKLSHVSSIMYCMCLSSPVTYSQSELPLKEATTLGLENHGAGFEIPVGNCVVVVL